MATAAEARTKRLSESAVSLLARAAGSPAEIAAKAARLAAMIAGYMNKRELDDRLDRLERAGIIDKAPARIQLIVGSYDMLRFWISPAASEYYRSIGINYTFHQ